MARLTLNEIVSGYAAIAELNSNFQAIAAEFEKVLYRDGEVDNTVTANIDINSNRLLNLPDPVDDQEPVTKGWADNRYPNSAAAANAEAAAASAAAAATSSTNAAASETAAAASASAASTSATNATASETSAASSASSAASSATSASGSATSAAASAAAAGADAAAAAASEGAAATSASNAAAAAGAASTSETNAAASASAANTSAINAASSASSASTAATNAANSASSASISATNAANSASAAATSATNAGNSATAAASSASAAATSESNAASSASAAATSASNAATSESNAASSASSASTSASNASSSASAAATSASNAATSEANAAASYDSFDDRYLGSKTSDPTTDNDGNALLTGALYWNTTDVEMKVYNGSAWQALSPASAALPKGYVFGLATNNNTTDPNNDIDIATGKVRSNDDSVDLELSSSLTKRLDAAWLVGTNQGGLDTGTKANSTLYAVWLIRRSDTGVVDALFSTSFSSPTMPSGYDAKALIGAVRTNSSGNIMRYEQSGDWFYYAASAEGRILSAGTATSLTAVTYTGMVPSVANKMQLWLYCDYSYPNTINAGVHLFIGVRSGLVMQPRYRLSTGNTGTDYITDVVVLPVTGWFGYYRALQGAASGGSTYFDVQGFELPRGKVA